MELTDKLTEMVHRDLQEGKCSRSQEYLYEVGIQPSLPPNTIYRALKESLGNPIVFLFKAHQALVKIEADQYEKTYWEAKSQKKQISPFSINERILLTCAFHIHFPVFLKKLDKILPPPKPNPKVLWAKKPAKEKRPYYSSPYLEPLPINERPWFEERLEEELGKKVELQNKLEAAKKEKILFENKIAQQKRLADKEKQDKENKRQGIIRKRMKMKAKLQQKLKKVKAVPEEDFENFVLEAPSEANALPLRERKSEFFKSLHQSPSMATPSYNTLVVSKETLRKDVSEKSEASKGSIRTEDPLLWVEVTGCERGTQTTLRGRDSDTMYTPYLQDEDSPVVEEKKLCLRRAPEGGTEDKWNQTLYTKELQPIKRAMRDFLLKQKGIQKQLEKFYQASMYKRGIFGPPTNSLCTTSCLLDLEWMAINNEITVLKPPATFGEDDSDDEYKLVGKAKVPKDLSNKELVSVKRIRGQARKPLETRRMSGPPIPEYEVLAESVLVHSGPQEISPPQILPEKHQDPPKIEESQKPIPVECKDPGCELIFPEDLPYDEFTIARKRIAILPMKKQLSVAVQYLSEKGDPLAILPNMEQVPWLQSWFNKRNGIYRKLTQKDKDELMDRSARMWNSEYTHCTAAPLPVVPKTVYTWYNKNWLMDYLGKITHDHRRKVKHILIDNARDLFPTMFCEYFDSPLNRTYRQAFYTYFPACERDCTAKPWDPSEHKNPQETS